MVNVIIFINKIINKSQIFFWKKMVINKMKLNIRENKEREKDKNSTKSSFCFQISTQGQKSQKIELNVLSKVMNLGFRVKGWGLGFRV